MTRRACFCIIRGFILGKDDGFRGSLAPVL